MRQLKLDYRQADLSPKDRAMLDYAAKMARHHHEATATDIQRLRDVGFTDADILHIVYWIASFNMANTITDALGYEVHEHITAIFVDEEAAAELDPERVERDGLHQEHVRPGWERGIVRALEGHKLTWLNSSPLQWTDVAGKVLLVMYWDAVLPNAHIGLPHLQRWHDTYADAGLVVLAPHVAEFPAAKEPAVAARVVAEKNLTVPVILDPTFRQMAGANNRFWPAIHLIDRSGYVRYRHYGPGGYDTIDAMLQVLLNENVNESEAAATLAVPNELVANPWLHPAATPELYARYKVGRKAEGIAGTVGRAKAFTIPAVAEQQPHHLYVAGMWIPSLEGLTLTEEHGSLTMSYVAERGGIFLSPGNSGSTGLQIRLDGEPLPAAHAGEAMQGQEPGRLMLNEIGYYELVAHPTLEAHRLEIEVQGAGSTIYRLSFLPFCGETDS